MLALNKRQSELYQIIKTSGTAEVKDLLSQFDVSAATVRKDLTALESAGMIIRTHGEAHLVERKSTQMTPFEARSCLHLEAKQQIALAAAKEIHDGDSIIMDSGSTTLEIAKLLVDRQNLTIITNSLPIAYILSSSPVSVILVGGMFQGQNFSTQGPEAEAYFQRIEADKLFISSTGVRHVIGMVASDQLEASIKKSMIGAAHTVYAVLDSSKFSIGSINLFANFSEIDYLITEKRFDDCSLTERFEQLGTKIIIAE